MGETVLEQLSNTLELSGQVKKFGANLIVDPQKIEIPKDIPLVIDIETDGVDGFVGIGLTWNGSDIYYFSNPIFILDKIAKHPLIGHNIKYDLHQLRKWKAKVSGASIFADTMIMSYVMDTTAEGHGLKPLAKKWLNMDWCEYKDLVSQNTKKFQSYKAGIEGALLAYVDKLTLPRIKKLDKPELLVLWKQYKSKDCTLNFHEVETVANYCGSDVLATWRLYQLLYKRMNPYQKRIYNTLELPVLKVIFDMEVHGIKINTKQLSELYIVLGKQLSTLRQKINHTLGCEVNPKSPKQLAPILEKHGFKLPKTKKGNKSTSKIALAKYAGNEIIDLLLEHSVTEKLFTTYIEGFQKIETLPMIYPTFNQIRYNSEEDEWEGMSTNRLSCNSPNMQQIPKKDKKDKKRAGLIRAMFIPEDGKTFICGDYNQIEYRILAHMSQDTTLIGAFNNGKDLHQEVANSLGCTREPAKQINYATIYGAQAPKVAQLAKISVQEAEVLLKKHEQKFPKIYYWKNQQLVKAKQLGGITTMLGRFIPIAGLKSDNMWDRMRAERQAINYIIQGSAAEVIKLAMIRSKEAGYQPILQVHDELIFEVNSTQGVPVHLANITQIMESVVKLDVPLDVDIHTGGNWNEAKG